HTKVPGDRLPRNKFHKGCAYVESRSCSRSKAWQARAEAWDPSLHPNKLTPLRRGFCFGWLELAPHAEEPRAARRLEATVLPHVGGAKIRAGFTSRGAAEDSARAPPRPG